MKTVRMFGRTVTLHASPLTVVIKHSSGETFRAPVMGHTTEDAERMGLRAFRAAHPSATVDHVSTEQGHR